MTYHTQHHSWKLPFFIATIGLGVLLILNDIAIRLALYSGYRWIDIPFHFIGGFCVGLAGIGLFRMVFGYEVYKRSPQLLIITLFVLFVGMLWEAVEAYYNVSILFGGNFWFDTYKDLLMDTLGGILSYICFHPHKKNL